MIPEKIPQNTNHSPTIQDLQFGLDILAERFNELLSHLAEKEKEEKPLKTNR